ncbi:ABC transporter ATP-binding protein [Planomonospora venezuelensis]|uniref:ATP-binding cassette subfamily C protein n=1 Tax=Planomonospora venezuelensis TaxID=1999 RepID=A0A841DHF5_PLAVE|nr:ABC transporter ATP-binding protein [Planomonospora venezuelensis]MBB5968143.1 ATP-binding cassette subfamily C protein [Planomonospora venezuelensis]GIN03768.1 ABC transporter ATP-binding protein [Planomonospora venezuelensis]
MSGDPVIDSCPTPATHSPIDGGAPSPWRTLMALLRPRRRPLAVAALWSLVEGAPALSSGLLIATAVDRGFLAGRFAAGLGWLALLGGTLLVRAVAMRRMFPALAAVVEPLRDDLVRAVVTTTVHRAATGGRAPDGAAVGRLTQQVETLRSLMSGMLISGRELGVSLVAALAGLLLLSPPAAAIVAGPVIVALVVFARLLRLIAVRHRDLLLAGETLTAEATPILAGLRDIAAGGAQAQAEQDLRALVAAQAAATRALAWAGTGKRLLLTLGAHVPLIGLLLAAPPLIARGQLTAGEVVGAVTYLSTGLGPALRSLMGTVGSWGVSLAVTLRRISETIAPDSETPARPGPISVPAAHDLQLDGLTFAYSPQAAPVVRELSLTIGEGTHLAVVGPSGIGKSTLAMLLTGLQGPTAGEVRLGGLPLATIPESHLRTVMALVPQEAYVFAGTVRENLAYLCPEDSSGSGAADERMRAAVAAVGADFLVERLGGLDATIEEPSTLSAGERQLITLVRAYASPARIVILDEATCHLDPAAEERAEQAFATRGTTLVVIAHRISSAARADNVLLIDGASAVVGAHLELIARSPLYADLVGHWQDDATHEHQTRGHHAASRTE